MAEGLTLSSLIKEKDSAVLIASIKECKVDIKQVVQTFEECQWVWKHFFGTITDWALEKALELAKNPEKCQWVWDHSSGDIRDQAMLKFVNSITGAVGCLWAWKQCSSEELQDLILLKTEEKIHYPEGVRCICRDSFGSLQLWAENVAQKDMTSLEKLLFYQEIYYSSSERFQQVLLAKTDEFLTSLDECLSFIRGNTAYPLKEKALLEAGVFMDTFEICKKFVGSPREKHRIKDLDSRYLDLRNLALEKAGEHMSSFGECWWVWRRSSGELKLKAENGMKKIVHF